MPVGPCIIRLAVESITPSIMIHVGLQVMLARIKRFQYTRDQLLLKYLLMSAFSA